MTGSAFLAACGSSGGSQPGTASGSPANSTGSKSSSGATLIVGTTDKVYALDPAGAFDAGSGTITTEVYATLLDHPAGSNVLQPSLAASSGFASPTEYKVVLKPGLKFANGDSLTSTDVAFSFDRQLKIASSVGPSSLLYNLASVAAVSPATVVFHLKSGGDQTFPQILASAAGQIVDHNVFSATSVTPDSTILARKPYDGPYAIASYQANQLVQLQANPNSHDLAVIDGLADTVGVLYHGKLVEYGGRYQVLTHPAHEYTRGLIAASPVPDPVEQAARRAARFAAQESVGR